MPYYFITLKLKNRMPVQVIREYTDTNLEIVFQKLHYKAEEKYGRDLLYFNCMTLSKQSPEAKAYIERKMKKR